MMAWLDRSLQNKMCLLTGGVVSLSLIGLGLLSHSFMAASLEQLAIEQRTQVVHLRSARLVEFLRSVDSDLHIIRHLPALRGLSRAHEHGGIDLRSGDDTATWRRRVTEALQAYAAAKPHYTQLRYLDSAGREEVRVDVRDGAPFVVPADQLQDKSSSRYFTDTMRLPPGSTNVSRVELNREHGRIEVPHRPVLRLSAPVFSDAGQRQGVVVINVLASEFLDEIKRVTKGADVHLVDEEGHYLAHPRAELEFGFDLGRDATLFRDHPGVADVLLAGQSGFLPDVDGQLIAHAPVRFDPGDPGRYWTVVAVVDRDVLLASVITFRRLFVAALAAVLAVSLVVTWIFARRLSRPLQRVAELADRIAQGDLRSEPMRLPGQDEVGRLSRSFDTMLASLRDISAQTRNGTSSLTSSTSEILASTKEQATSTSEQATAVQETTSTVEEISQSGAQIAERAERVAAAAEATTSSTASGIQAVEETSRAMAAIRDQAQAVAENVISLSEQTQAIGEIIATVNDISEQSNLLALNAAIEAAAAGEHGRSFAVVAGEMKTLSEQAREATVQVQSILQEIQKGINTSVMLTEEAVKRVDSGEEQTKVTEQAIRHMSDGIRESVEAFQQIVAATNQQQIGLEQITLALRDIRQATEQTAAGTKQTEAAAADLNTLGRQLQTTVERYVV